MKARKLIVFLTVLALVAVMFSACSSKPKSSASSNGGEKAKPKIGFIVQDESNEYFVSCIVGMKAYCKAYGYGLTICNGKSDAQTQVSQMEDLANAGVNVIDLRAVDTNALSDAVGAAVAKGVLVSTYPNVANNTCWMHYDEYDQGYAMGTEAAKWINTNFGGHAELAYLTQPTIVATMQRIIGCRAALAKLCPGAKEDACVQGVTSEQGNTATQSLLQAHPDLKLILCSDDSGGEGAYEAVVSAHKTASNFFIGGIDGDNQALKYIAQNGIYKVSIAGKLTNPKATWEVINNVVDKYYGRPSVKELKLDIETVTYTNAQAYLDEMNAAPDYSLVPDAGIQSLSAGLSSSSNG